MKNARSTFNILYNKIIKGHSFIHKTCFFSSQLWMQFQNKSKRKKKPLGRENIKEKSPSLKQPKKADNTNTSRQKGNGLPK